MKRGIFISLEGGEGLGKSTQAEALRQMFRNDGIPCIRTREPGGTILGGQMRQILLESQGYLAPTAELLLMLADRAQHVNELIKPALEEGKVVICDRYMDSTFAYQGAGRGHSHVDLLFLHESATGGLVPDITFVMEGEPFRHRGDDRFERLDDAFHARVRDYFHSLPATANRYVRVNANRDPQKITDELYRIANERLHDILTNS